MLMPARGTRLRVGIRRPAWLAVIGMTWLSTGCFIIGDPDVRAPLVLANRTPDSVTAVYALARYNIQHPDTAVLLKVVLGPGETRRTDEQVWRLSTVVGGAHPSWYRFVMAENGSGAVWSSPLLRTWWHRTGMVVEIPKDAFEESTVEW